MATNSAPFPTTGESPYGDKVQDYIDTGDDAVEAAAKSDASAKVTAHEAAENPHPQYALPGGLPEGMEYDPDAVALQMGDLVEESVKISLDGFEAWGSTGTGSTTVGMTSEAWMALSSPLEGPPTGFVLNWEMLAVVKAGTARALVFPEGEWGAALPEEGTGSAPHTLATREWVADQPVVEMTHYGTGNPNGQITAPIGSVFRNTEAGGWNGARVWRKDTGTGNTGWVVESGDTGWRDLSSYLVNGAAKGGGAAPEGGSERIRIRRIGDTVTLQVSLALPTWVNGQAALDFPSAGFSTTMQYMPPGYATSPHVVLQGGQMKIYTASPTSGARYMWTWPTDQSWPTTLPGTPA